MSVLTHLYVMISRKKCRLPTDSTLDAFKPTWCPTGSGSGAYLDAGRHGHIWKVRADGSGTPQQLTKVSAFYLTSRSRPTASESLHCAALHAQTFSEFGGLRIPLDLVWLPANGGTIELIVPARISVARTSPRTRTACSCIERRPDLVALRRHRPAHAHPCDRPWPGSAHAARCRRRGTRDRMANGRSRR